MANEEILLDGADLQPVNQDRSTHDVVSKAEEWSFKVVIEDAGGEDASDDNEAHEVIVIV